MDKENQSKKIYIIHTDHNASDRYKSKLIMSGLFFGFIMGFIIGMIIGLLIGMAN